VEGYTQADADFRTLLTKIADTDPDVLYLPDYYAKAGQILSQVEELGLDMPVIGPDGYDGIEEDYADVAEGVYFTNHFAKTDEAEIVQNFISNYEAKWDRSPTALAALGYDAAYIMAEAIERAGSTDGEAIVNALNETEIDGVTGHIVFDENGDPQKSISIIQLIDGELTLADKVSAK
jgi:branched-chain amino acid transport system substrate-binding protein